MLVFKKEVRIAKLQKGGNFLYYSQMDRNLSLPPPLFIRWINGKSSDFREDISNKLFIYQYCEVTSRTFRYFMSDVAENISRNF